MVLVRGSGLGGLAVFISCLVSSFTCSSPIDDISWHLPMIGPIAPRLSHKSASLRFLRHPNSTVRLSGPMPSLAIAITEANVLAAINPRDGSIVWRFAHDEHDSIIEYAIQLDHGLVAVISGSKQIAVRLFNLSDGRIVWESSLVDDNNSDLGSFYGADIMFSSDDSSERESFPDIFIVYGGSKVSRLSGHSGEIIWKWTSEASQGRVFRVMPQLHADQVSLVLGNDIKDQIHNTQVQTLSSVSGLSREHRPQSHQMCHRASGNPIILQATQETNAQSHVIVCIDDKGDVSSALVPESPLGKLVVSSYTPPDHKHPILEDVGLAQLGFFVVKYPNGAATVLRTTPQGKLTLVWTFDQSDPDASYSGSIDRNGLPYVSKVTYADSLGLGSLEILSLTPTQFTPEGMVTGQTFAYDRPENGRVICMAVEVLQIHNYVPMSRVLLVTDFGTIQLWQGEDLQWERHEDLSLSTAINLYQPKYMSGSLPNTVPSHLPNYFVQLTKQIIHDFFSLKSRTADSQNRQHLHSNIWLIGTKTGRLFAITRGKNGLGKVLWKRSLLEDESHSLEGSIKWSSIVLERKKHSQTVEINASLILSESTELFSQLRLSDGKILKSFARENQASRQSSVDQPPLSKTLLALHDRDLGGSPARFLGDRSAIFKYHNPDLSVYFSENFGRQIIEVIDQKSGALIWAFKFQVQVDPSSLRATLTENWLVIASRENSTGFTKVYSIEWYMSSRPDIRVDGSSVNITDCSKTYLMPFEVKATGITKSRLGVTSRALLAVTDNDQVISIPRRLLDCRRPLSKPTPLEIEERLIPYDPVIYPDPKTIITSGRETMKLNSVYSFPTEFESTSAVISVGLDLFVTSTAPSRTFDMLGLQFNKAQLILTASALLLANLIFRPMVKNRQLRQQWYN